MTLNETTEVIKDFAFEAMTNVATISILKGIEEIGTGDFKDCSSLRTISVVREQWIQRC